MKTQTFKTGEIVIQRITITAKEIDALLIGGIVSYAPGLGGLATLKNCRPLFPTTDKTYELRLPAASARALDVSPASPVPTKSG